MLLEQLAGGAARPPAVHAFAAVQEAARAVPSIVKPTFSATRREAWLPTLAHHSMRPRPSSAKPQRQASRTASVMMPRPRAQGAIQNPTSRIVASRACRPIAPTGPPTGTPIAASPSRSTITQRSSRSSAQELTVSSTHCSPCIRS